MLWLFMANPSHSYGASHAIWNHTVLPATRHRWTCSSPRHNPSHAGRYLICLPRRDGRLSWPWCWLYWDGLPVRRQSPTGTNHLIATQPGVEPTTSRSHAQRPNPLHYQAITKKIWMKNHITNGQNVAHGYTVQPQIPLTLICCGFVVYNIAYCITLLVVSACNYHRWPAMIKFFLSGSLPLIEFVICDMLWVVWQINFSLYRKT